MKIDIPFVVADGRLASIATEADAVAALKKAICDFVNMLADLKGDISMQLSDYRRQNTENRKQKTEIRNQKSDIEAVGGHLLEGE